MTVASYIRTVLSDVLTAVGCQQTHLQHFVNNMAVLRYML